MHEPAHLGSVGPRGREIEQQAALAHGQRKDHHRRNLHEVHAWCVHVRGGVCAYAIYSGAIHSDGHQHDKTGEPN